MIMLSIILTGMREVRLKGRGCSRLEACVILIHEGSEEVQPVDTRELTGSSSELQED